MTPILTVEPKPSDKRNTALDAGTKPKRQRARQNSNDPKEPNGPHAMKARKPRPRKKTQDCEKRDESTKEKTVGRPISLLSHRPPPRSSGSVGNPVAVLPFPETRQPDEVPPAASVASPSAVLPVQERRHPEEAPPEAHPAEPVYGDAPHASFGGSNRFIALSVISSLDSSYTMKYGDAPHIVFW